MSKLETVTDMTDEIIIAEELRVITDFFDFC
jgi:hypothetical protein